MSDLFSGSIEQLGDAMGGLSLRQRTLSNNIANAETPGFKRSEVRFEDLLRRRAAQEQSEELTATNPMHISGAAPAGAPFIPEISVAAGGNARPDGNNVDLETEMGSLLRNELSYNAAAQMLSRKLGELRLAISEGR